MLRYLLTFVAVAVALFGLYWLTEIIQWFRVVNELNAILSAALLNLIGVQNQQQGTLVSFTSGGMEIISECTGIYVIILFTAGVIAFPTTWSARARGLLLGIPIILVINLLRLVTLGAIIAYRQSLLPLFHEYLWQVLFILVVAALYLIWIERMVPRARADSAA